ncbi:MAG: hypothetical protein VW455_13705 [Nitrospinota bacterium]
MMKNPKAYLKKLSINLILAGLLLFTSSPISLAGEPFVNKIRVKGNTLIDPQSLKDHFDLGNGLKMNPYIMDLAASELRSVYRYHGHPDVDSYTVMNKRNGVLTLKVNEEREYRYGAARAELAVYNLDWDFNMKTTEAQKDEAIRKLVQGYKKITLNEKVVTSFLIKGQRERIEEIHSEEKKAMREKIARAVKDFKERNLAKEKEWALKLEEMKKRVRAAKMKKEMAEMNKPKEREFGEITPFERSAF